MICPNCQIHTANSSGLCYWCDRQAYMCPVCGVCRVIEDRCAFCDKVKATYRDIKQCKKAGKAPRSHVVALSEAQP